MKKLYRVVALVLVFVLVVSSYVQPVQAKNFSNSPTTADFEAAYKEKATKLLNNKLFYTTNVQTAKQGEIKHIAPGRDGFYKIYSSQVNGDPKCSIYERTKGGLFSKAKFTQLFSNDDGYDFIGNNGNTKNYMMVQELLLGTDYFVISQYYGSGTGMILNNIEPNDDKVYSEVGGIWKADEGPFQSHLSSEYKTKQYYTKNQAALLYNLACLCDEQPARAREFCDSFAKKGTDGALQKFVELGFGTYSVIDGINTISEACGGVCYSISAGLSAAILISEFVLNEIFSLINESYKQGSAKDYMIKLQDCGAKSDNDPKNPLIAIRSCPNAVCVSTYWSGAIDIEVYNSNYLVGELYWKGTWSGIGKKK